MRRPALRRPVVGIHWPPTRRVVKSRGQVYHLSSNVQPQIHIATLPRRRSAFALATDELRELARLRRVARRIGRLGFRRVAPAVWYDPQVDVHYLAVSWAPAGGLNSWEV